MTRWRDRDLKARLTAFGIAAAIGVPLVVQPAKRPGNADASEVYRGTDGPLEAIVAERAVETRTGAGETEAGAAIRAVPAGGVFAWVSVLCPGSDLQVSIESRLVRLVEAARSYRLAEQLVVAWSDRNWPAGALACGPLVAAQHVPRDAPPGDYALLRSLTVRAGRGTATTRQLPPIHLTVTTPPSP